MMLILDRNVLDDALRTSTDDSWAARRRSVLDHRFEQRADLDASECLRDHTPSARTLERLGFRTALARPDYSAQRRLGTSNARRDPINPDWRPL